MTDKLYTQGELKQAIAAAEEATVEAAAKTAADMPLNTGEYISKAIRALAHTSILANREAALQQRIQYLEQEKLGRYTLEEISRHCHTAPPNEPMPMVWLNRTIRDCVICQATGKGREAEIRQQVNDAWKQTITQTMKERDDACDHAERWEAEIRRQAVSEMVTLAQKNRCECGIFIDQWLDPQFEHFDKTCPLAELTTPPTTRCTQCNQLTWQTTNGLCNHCSGDVHAASEGQG